MRLIKSAVEGKVWGISYGKSPKRPGYWYANEGELKDGFFSFMMFQSRSCRKPVIGKATAKAKQAALDEMLEEMKEAGLIKEAS